MPADTERRAQKGNGDAQKKGPIVLVIDDDAIGRTLVCETLREVFPSLLESSSPIGASRTVIQEHVDVVVLDVEMPNLRGNKLAKLFRENPRLAYIGVILVSACGSEELAALGEACGADGVVTKHNIRTSLQGAVTKAWRASVSRRGTNGSGGSSLRSTGPGGAVGAKGPKNDDA
jgi:CheY-like chemotaxis protein